MHLSMLKSYQRNLIEAWINIYNLVTLDFSPGTTALLPSHLSSFQRLASGCFDNLFDANHGTDGRCTPRVFAPPTEDRGLKDVRCIFTFKSVSMVILNYKFFVKRSRTLCRTTTFQLFLTYQLSCAALQMRHSCGARLFSGTGCQNYKSSSHWQCAFPIVIECRQ
jgi:hypothetical protein